MKTFSLRTRLTLLLALAVLVALGAAARIVDLRADSDMRQRFDVSVLTRAQSLVTAVEAADEDRDAGAASAASVFPGSTGKSWYELRCDGRVVARTPQVPPEIPVSDTPTFADVHLASRPLRAVALRFRPAALPGSDTAGAPASCVLRYAVDSAPLGAILHKLDLILLGSLLSACAVVMLATPWLVRRGLRPLSGLAHAMGDIGPDTPGSRLPTSSTAELVPLVTRFNEVLARMDNGLARERQFASGVAHEFRTRLAELRTLVDVETRYPSGRDVRTVLREAGNIGAELEATVSALLKLTRIESGLERPLPEPVPPALWVQRACARHQGVADRRKVRVAQTTTCAADFAIYTDPTLVGIVIDNLIGNAIAYAPRDSAIDVRTSPESIEVRNEAPLLQPGDVVLLGQRFWRKGAPDSGHAGLGLALAGAASRALDMSLVFALEDGVLHATLRWRT